MKVIDRKDAINRRLYNDQSFVLTAIYRVSFLNRTVLEVELRKQLKVCSVGYIFPGYQQKKSPPEFRRRIIL